MNELRIGSPPEFPIDVTRCDVIEPIEPSSWGDIPDAETPVQFILGILDSIEGWVGG